MFKRDKWKNILTLIAMMIVMMVAGYIYGFYQISDMEQPSMEEGADTSKLTLAEGKNKEDNEIVTPVISPGTDMVFRRYYLRCKDVAVEKRKPYNEEVGSSLNVIQARFPEWVIEEFSDTILILRKEIDNFCSNHYILQEQHGLVTIYIPIDEGLKMFNQTSIKVSMLPLDLQEEVKKGLVVDSLEQVENLMESWES